MIPVYVINLKRSTERRKFIENELNKNKISFRIVEGVDAMQLPDIDSYAINNNKEKQLPRGHIGCVLSHVKVFQEIVDNYDEFALVIEDDILINKDVPALLKKLPAYFDENKVVFLSAGIHREINFNTIHKIDSNYSLCEASGPSYFIRGTQAYIVSRKVAMRLAQELNPVHGFIDNWEYYRELGWIENYQIVFPFPILHGDFLSDLAEEKMPDLKSPKEVFKFLVYKHKLPFFYNWFLKVRRSRSEDRQRQFLLIDGKKVKKTFQ